MLNKVLNDEEKTDVEFGDRVSFVDKDGNDVEGVALKVFEGRNTVSVTTKDGKRFRVSANLLKKV